jgi:alcohol dehydrogenase class IV
MKDQILYGIAETRGDGLVCILCARLKDIQASHIFLVRGRNSYVQCGADDVMKEVLIRTDAYLTPFTDFSVNPKIEEVNRGVDQVLKDRPDVIIAIGGGSAMDTAKLIRHYAAEKGYTVPLWAIPTTAGTGAEATHFAVVYVNDEKKSIEAEDILPDIALLYPSFTYGNSAYLTACTGFDALAQAIEAYWNPNATDESDFYALRAIAYLHDQLPKCIKNPNDAFYRDALMNGAYWAGRAINITKTTAPHAFSYAFTTHCGYPHGHAVAITFPFFAGINLKDTWKENELRWFLCIDQNVDLQQYFLDYVRNIGLTYKGTNNWRLRDLLLQVNIERLRNNPIVITDEMVSRLQSFIEFI